MNTTRRPDVWTDRLEGLRAARRARRGMTLMEVMIVIAIILLLMGALTFGLAGMFGEAQADTARLQIARINERVRIYQVKKRKLPKYPEAAESMNLGDQRCRVSVTIDEKGIPFRATVTGCPKVFHQEAKQAILQWRWYPPKVDRQKVKAQTLIAVVFKAK